ncbi:claudin-34-like [Rhynchocyon petersi]
MVLVRSAHCQLAGFIAVTIGWILSITSIGLVEWRVWNITRSPPSGFSEVHVGMWDVCIYDSKKNGVCHYYTHPDTYLPVSLRSSRSLLLLAFVIGVLGKAAFIFAFRNRPLRNPTTTLTPYTTAGLLYMCAGCCVSISVIWCYYCLKINEGISFPSNFHLPFQPDSQQAGVGLLLAAVSALLMLFGSLGIFAKTVPPVREEAAET